MSDEIAKLQDSDIPQSILMGCKTPMPMAVRAVAAVVIAMVWLFVMTVVKAQLASSLRGYRDLVGVVWLIVLCASFYKFTPGVWLFLRENLRDCTIYHKFRQFYREEIMKRGMTKDLAIDDAVEKVQLYKQQQRQRQLNRNAGRSGVRISF